jgi:hypothetical protein
LSAVAHFLKLSTVNEMLGIPTKSDAVVKDEVGVSD